MLNLYFREISFRIPLPRSLNWKNATMKLGKPLLITLLVAGLVVGAALYFNGKNLVPGAATTLSTDIELRSADLSGDSVLSKLSSKVMLFISFEPRRFDVIGEFFKSAIAQLGATKIGKKANLAEKSALLGDKFFQGVAQGAKEDPETVNSVRDNIYNVWNSLSRLNLVIKVGSKVVIEGIVVPQVMLTGSFTNSSSIDQLFSVIDTRLPEGSEPVVNLDATFTRTAKREVRLVVASGDQSVSGQLKATDSTLQLLFNADAESDFYVATGESSLLASTNFQSVAKGALPQEAMLIYFDFEHFLPYYDKIIEKLPAPKDGTTSKEDLKNMMEAMVSTPLREMKSFVSSFSFDDGLSSRQCVAVVPNSSAETYQKTMSASKRRDDGYDVNFTSLISDRTVLAISIDSSAIEAELDQLTKLFRNVIERQKRDPSVHQKTRDEEIKKFTDFVEQYKATFTELGFGEFGLRINSTSTGPFPEVVLLLGRSKLKSQDALQTLHKCFTDIARTLKFEEQLKDKLVWGANKAGARTLELVASDAAKVVFEPFGEHSVLISGRVAMMISPPDDIAKREDYFSKITVGGTPVNKVVNDASVFFFINLKAAFEMTRSFIPVMLATQPFQGESRIEIADIDELFETLGVSLLGFQRTMALPSATYCTDAWWKRVH